MVKKIVEQIPVTGTTPTYQRIAWWFENTVIRAIVIVFNVLSKPITDLFSFSITNFIEDFESELIVFARPIANEILNTPNMPTWVKSPIERALSGTSQAGIITVGALVGALIFGVVSGASRPMATMIEYQVNRLFRPYLFQPDVLLEMFKRGIIDSDELNKLLSMNGVSADGITALKGMAKPLYDDATLTQLYYKKSMSKVGVENELKLRGFSLVQVRDWFIAREQIPSPGDLVSIAVREGFNDSVAAQFGYDADYPQVAADWAEQAGMQPVFFKALWRSHWSLPGLTQVREMYHRGIVDSETLNTYLRAADIPVFWRNAITKWIDSVVTRVDARRMYQAGIWDETRVKAHYQELGYTPQDAADMTIWTALEYLQDDRELTKTDILSMYRGGILNENEATLYLGSLDYKPSAIALLLAHQELKRIEAYETRVISNVQKLYVSGLYDRQDVFAQLGKLDTPNAVMHQSLAVWDLEKELKVKVPSVTQMRDMVLGNVISINEFRQELSNKKYPDKYIQWYIELWELE